MDFIFYMMLSCAIFLLGWWIGVFIGLCCMTNEFIREEKVWIKKYAFSPLTSLWRGPIWLFKNARSIPAKLRIVFPKD